MSNFVGKRPNPLAAAIQGAVKLFGKKQKTTGTEVIKSVKPGTTFTGTPKYTKEMIKARGEVQKKFGKINEGIKKETTQLRQTLQKIRGEKVTKSGISKGKDVTPGVYKEKKAKGGRIGYKRGTGLKRKSNVEKIKETFSPKNKIKFDAKKSDLDKSGDLSKYEKARGMAIAKAMAKRKNKKVI